VATIERVVVGLFGDGWLVWVLRPIEIQLGSR